MANGRAKKKGAKGGENGCFVHALFFSREAKRIIVIGRSESAGIPRQSVADHREPAAVVGDHDYERRLPVLPAPHA